MTNFWRTTEQVVMHIVAVAVMLFALWIAVTPVHAHPHCHQHNGMTHCH